MIGRRRPESYGRDGHPSFTLCGYDIRRMESDYDPEGEAEAAMKMAVMAIGPERQRLIRLAMAWHELARMRSPRVPRSDGRRP